MTAPVTIQERRPGRSGTWGLKPVEGPAVLVGGRGWLSPPVHPPPAAAALLPLGGQGDPSAQLLSKSKIYIISKVLCCT